jgi:hypothetical protein
MEFRLEPGEQSCMRGKGQPGVSFVITKATGEKEKRRPRVKPF